MKNKLILILALVVGLAAAGGIYFFLDNMQKTYREEGDFVKIVAAKQRIPAKTMITDQMVEIKELPAKYINTDAAVDPQEVIGKTVKSEILPGEQVLRSRLAGAKGSSEGLSYMIEPGKRAVTIAVNEISGVAGQILPGDRVDIMGTFDNQGILTTLILQNIPVLSVDQTTDTSGPGENKTQARTLTLSVNPDQMQPLVLCSEMTTIRLALRSAADNDILNLPMTRMNNLIH
ncbi:MAG: Flp pilus assembly protein CpaB [Desulfotomaculaceae bacterium]|nr:Flp pilus assembly protein CpaB [Desulfotomaculaceae bacterium]MDD4766137.1 Flp pilus assembly protein CpaB [Desulfotomaculaceae bacterium]